MTKQYQIHEFADLAGVTIKALHHYDRMGLLRPARTNAGYRMYSERDLERLEQIVALKFLGLPLKQIRTVLDRAELALPEALRMQRRAIQEKQQTLQRALQAIQAAEEALSPGKPANPAILKKIIEVIDMHDDMAQMKKYYSDAEWDRRKRFYQEGPGLEWRDLYREVATMLDEDPGSDRAQEIAGRWLDLSLRAHFGEGNLQTHSGTAWMNREEWPPAMKKQIAEYRLEEVHEFIRQTSIASRKKYFTPEAWQKLAEIRKHEEENFPMWWQTLVDLYRDVEASLTEDPAGEPAQSLVARWRERMDRSSGGDPAVKEGLTRAWSDRRNWPSILRYQAEVVYGMSYERFLLTSDFIDRAANYNWVSGHR